MDENDFVGISSKVFLKCIKREDGTWEVQHTFISSRTRDGVVWEDKEVNMKSYAKDLATAVTNAQLSVNTYLAKHNYDLFSIDEESKG